MVIQRFTQLLLFTKIYTVLHTRFMKTKKFLDMVFKHLEKSVQTKNLKLANLDALLIHTITTSKYLQKMELLV